MAGYSKSDASYRRRLEMRSTITPLLVKQTTNTESLRQLGNQKKFKAYVHHAINNLKQPSIKTLSNFFDNFL